MLSETKEVFGPDELNSLQSSFNDAWAMLRLLVDAHDAQRAKARLGQIILRLHYLNVRPDEVSRNVISRYQTTDIQGYLDTCSSSRLR